MYCRKWIIGVAALAAGPAASLTAVADPVAGSAYFTDSQQTTLTNAPTRPIEDIDKILCVFARLQAGQLVNAGDYIALLEGSECGYEPKHPAALAMIANSATEPLTAATRVKGWLNWQEAPNGEFMPVASAFNFAVTQFPSPSRPWGKMRVDVTDRHHVYGVDQTYLQSAGSKPAYFHRYTNGPWTETHALRIASLGATTGRGRYAHREQWQGQVTGESDFYFAYDAQHALLGAQCLSRDENDPDAAVTVFEYALYDENGARVAFDEYPYAFDFAFEVPNDPARYAQFAGTTLTLAYQYHDFQIPMLCTVAACKDAFVIPFDATLGRVTRGGQTFWVKWLDRYVELREKDASACAALTLPTNLTLPNAASLQDPSDPGSAVYIGTEPTVGDPPRVIDGVVQY